MTDTVRERLEKAEAVAAKIERKLAYIVGTHCGVATNDLRILLDAYFDQKDLLFECVAYGDPEIESRLAASPQGEGSSADTPVEAVAWRYRQTSQPEAWAVSLEDMSDWTNLTVQPLYTHPAPIKPSGDTGELRERVAREIEAAIERHNPGNSLRHTLDDADAILDLIQSERAGSPIGQNDQPGLA